MSPVVEHARFMFNIVFFITILSLLIQGTTVNAMARWLGLDDTVSSKAFDIDLPDEVDADMKELTVTPELLAESNLLSEITLPSNQQTLIVLIRRGDKYIVPKGDTRLHVGDRCLMLSHRPD